LGSPRPVQGNCFLHLSGLIRFGRECGD
jgi:hypothetical protein